MIQIHLTALTLTSGSGGDQGLGYFAMSLPITPRPDDSWLAGACTKSNQCLDVQPLVGERRRQESLTR